MVRSFWPVSALTEITSGGWPAKRSFQASFFDYARVAADGHQFVTPPLKIFSVQLALRVPVFHSHSRRGATR